MEDKGHCQISKLKSINILSKYFAKMSIPFHFILSTYIFMPLYIYALLLSILFRSEDNKFKDDQDNQPEFSLGEITDAGEFDD